MENDINNLKELLPGLSPVLSDHFAQFFEIVEKYNGTINLVAKSTIRSAGTKHFGDSYLGISAFEDLIVGDHEIFDFGSGNGFPGIIAGMMFPNRKIILVERDKRKAEFLKIASSDLGLSNVEVHAGDVSEFQEGVCHYVISRAMAPIPKFLLEARKSVPVGGKVFLFKGDHWMRELSACPPQLFDYWDVNLHDAYILPDGDTKRYIVRCERT